MGGRMCLWTCSIAHPRAWFTSGRYHMQPNPHKTRSTAKIAETLLQRGKRGLLGSPARCFFQWSWDVYSRGTCTHLCVHMCVCVCGGGAHNHPFSYMPPSGPWCVSKYQASQCRLKNTDAATCTCSSRAFIFFFQPAQGTGGSPSRLSRILCFIWRVEFHNSWKWKIETPAHNLRTGFDLYQRQWLLWVEFWLISNEIQVRHPGTRVADPPVMKVSTSERAGATGIGFQLSHSSKCHKDICASHWLLFRSD